MLLRTRLTYDYYEIFHYILSCRCLMKKRSFSNSVTDRRHKQYLIGHEKLEKELDVINIIKNLRQLRLMTNFLLTKEQRILLKFQRRNVIDSTSSSSDSDHYSYDTIKLLNSKSELEKLRQIVKIKKTLNSLREKDLGPIERSLIKGLFVRRPENGPLAAEDHRELLRNDDVVPTVKIAPLD